jgi:hypothetical protein
MPTSRGRSGLSSLSLVFGERRGRGSRLSRDRAEPVTCTPRPSVSGGGRFDGLQHQHGRKLRGHLTDGRHLGSVRPASIIIILGFLSIVTSQLGIIQLSWFKEKPLWRFQVRRRRRIDYWPVVKIFLVIHHIIIPSNEAG